MCTVVNKYKSQYDVYIGRGSIWGNPFVMQSESQRTEVIAKYKKHLWDQIRTGEITKAQLIALDGKRLGCFCAPKPCHGDVIKAAVEWAVSN
jgi:hypothetical protein